jgi:hypothetical protein
MQVSAASRVSGSLDRLRTVLRRPAQGLACLALLVMCAPTQAADGGEAGWTIAPYGWLAGFDGNAGVASDDVDTGGGIDFTRLVNLSLDAERQEIGFMLYAEWRGERWMVSFDSVWANVKQDAELELLSLLPDSRLTMTVDGNVYQGSLGYRLVDTDRSAFVLYGGSRYYDLEVRLNAEGGLLPGPVSTSAATSWLDALIGARWTYRPAERWDVTVLADYGVGDSELSRQIFATAGFDAGWGTIRAGYRYLAVDYETDGFLLDAALQGPVLGAAFRF